MSAIAWSSCPPQVIDAQPSRMSAGAGVTGRSKCDRSIGGYSAGSPATRAYSDAFPKRDAADHTAVAPRPNKTERREVGIVTWTLDNPIARARLQLAEPLCKLCRESLVSPPPAESLD